MSISNHAHKSITPLWTIAVNLMVWGFIYIIDKVAPGRGGGFTVLRFENRFVFQDPEDVLEEISKKFNNHLGPE